MNPSQELARKSIDGARQMLAHAKLGRDDYREAGERRLSGLYACITSGRSVTFALQTMRGHVDGFDAWYEPVQDDLRSNEVARWFVELRNRIEKRGDLGGGMGNISYNLRITNEIPQPEPEGTIGFFYGDYLGRSGWEVRLPDGTVTDVFHQLPDGVVVADLGLTDAPGGRSIQELLDEWLASLEALVDQAESNFAER